VIDINTIKPGDKVMWPKSAPPGHGVNPGDVFTVNDPPVDHAGFLTTIRVIASDGRMGFVDPVYVVLFNEGATTSAGDIVAQEPSSCTCDIMSLMRVGCQCGHMAREREASRG
jgi:hypothetical protein